MNAILQHPAVLAISLYWLFSAIVGGMPDQDETSSFTYKWLYRSLHILSGDLKNAVASRFPSAITVPAGADVQHTASETTTIITK
jgi:hypothetical protein